MSQPPEDIRFDSTHIIAAYPIHRVEESNGSKGSGQHHPEKHHHPAKQDHSDEEPDPQDVVEVSSDYLAVVTSVPDAPVSRSSTPKSVGIPATVPSPTPELHLDIEA